MSDNSIPWLRDNTILLVMAGSRAYGTNTPTSDVDIKGVAIPPIQYFLGFANHFEQADKPMHAATFVGDLSPELQGIVRETKLEGSVYDIRKFFGLAADCNPNILDVLYCADSDVLRVTAVGELLRKNRDMFLSRVAKHRFSGYALSQLSRIKTHRKWLIDPPTAAPQREDFGLRPQVSIPMAQLQAVQAEVQKQLDRWNEGYMDDLSESSKIRVREGIAQLLAELKISSDIRYAAAARSMGFEENFIIYLQMEREYGNALRHWRQYLEWKDKRNEDRAILERKFGYDTKHAMHLVRLLRMCREILLTGRVNVKRPDSVDLLGIRNGDWSFDDLIEWADKEDRELTALIDSSPLPRSSNRKLLDDLCLGMVKAHLNL